MLTDCAAHLQRQGNKTTTSLGVLTGQLRRQVEGAEKPSLPVVPAAWGCRNPGLRAKPVSLRRASSTPLSVLGSSL